MSATIRPTRPKPTMIARSSSLSGSAPVALGWSMRRATRRPAQASNGVMVSPNAATMRQNCAVPGWMSCALAAAVSTINVASDGADSRMPVSAAVPAPAPIIPQQRGGDQRLDQQHPGGGQQDRPEMADDHRQVDLHAHGNQEHPQRQALKRRGHALDFAVIFGFGDQQAGNQRADDRRQPGPCGSPAPRRSPPAGWPTGTVRGFSSAPLAQTAGAAGTGPPPAVPRPPADPATAYGTAPPPGCRRHAAPARPAQK